MRAPVSWLAEHVAGLREFSPEQIDAALVRVGLEVEAVHEPGAQLTGPIVVGEVRQITELTEFKKPIRYCRVDVGQHNVDGEPRGIVCGARNFSEGDWVVVALPGAVLPGDFAIAARKTYGHVSDGMICAADELGIGSDHSGIIVLPRDGLPTGTQPGSDAFRVLGLDDTIFELAITPDRGYCLSIRGIARELSHALGLPFSDPAAGDTPASTDDSPYPVAGCRHRWLRPFRGQGCPRHRPDSKDSTMDESTAHPSRHASYFVARRHHELRDARAGSADACVGRA